MTIERIILSPTSSTGANSQSFTTPGTYSWIAPSGVRSISVVAVGSGGGAGWLYSGGGGALAYKNNIAVTPGSSYTVVVGLGGAANTASCGAATLGCVGSNSYFCSTSVVRGGGGRLFGAGGNYTGDGGGNGGGTGTTYSGGGGAGGYSGTGGEGGWCSCCVRRSPTAGAGGGGAGGGAAPFNLTGGGGGGGVGITGQGTSGVPLNNGCYGAACGAAGSGGGAGAGGNNGRIGLIVSAALQTGANGGGFGGGAGAGSLYAYCCGGTIVGCYRKGGAGANGAVRIVWPGTTRKFPSTCVR